MPNEVTICTSCWEEDCVCDYEWYTTLDSGIADVIIALNLKGYQTMYSCEGHISEDEGNNQSKVMDINIVCPNHRFDTLPEGFSYPKGESHRDIHRTILYKYVKGKLLARINGKYIPYDLDGDRQKYLAILKEWVDTLPVISIKEHPEYYSEYLVTGIPQASFHAKYEQPICNTFCTSVSRDAYEAIAHRIVGYGGKVLEVKDCDDYINVYYWAKENLFKE